MSEHNNTGYEGMLEDAKKKIAGVAEEVFSAMMAAELNKLASSTVKSLRDEDSAEPAPAEAAAAPAEEAPAPAEEVAPAEEPAPAVEAAPVVEEAPAPVVEEYDEDEEPRLPIPYDDEEEEEELPVVVTNYDDDDEERIPVAIPFD